MKVAVIVGSRRRTSTTRCALRVAARATGAELEWLDLRDLELPHCDGRADPASYGGDTPELLRAIAEADALLVGSPEYNGSFSGVLKNALDLAGEGAFKGKLVGILAVAKGDAGAMNTLAHLRHVLRWMGAWVLPTQVSIPRSAEAFDEAGEPVRPGLRDELEQLGRELVRYARLLAGA